MTHFYTRICFVSTQGGEDRLNAVVIKVIVYRISEDDGNAIEMYIR